MTLRNVTGHLVVGSIAYQSLLKAVRECSKYQARCSRIISFLDVYELSNILAQTDIFSGLERYLF